MISKQSLWQTLGFSAFLAIIVWIAWYYLAEPTYIQTHWEISLTMVFGALIAGATSEGGGAVAFPVFTKWLHISPSDAKIFSLAIQSVGMSAAALVIIYMRIPIEWRVIRWASLGGVLGIVLSSCLLAPILSAPVLKMSFTAMISSFAVTLFVLNRRTDRQCHNRLPFFGHYEKTLLLGAGFCGGVMGGLVGNGIDIITFSFMVLLFRLSEKIATPTSVILMAINALMGFALHLFIIGGFNSEVQAYWQAAIPVVVVGAPAGAILCTLLNRLTIARILMTLILVELISSLWLIPLTTAVMTSSLTTFMVFAGLYYWMYRCRLYEPSHYK
ncbi:permease [Candidatus Thiomargarita nelsonii]|uniref:Probable membrane transporter protein n=1 Tax=Candidatus Thiomargarita nelsonii TaxID=1003181 RepID=A0A0A6PFJ4_9GAMM|nr:permease [Candidatus Thiomargarita nelsonii]